MARVKSVNFTTQAIGAIRAADHGTVEHLKEAIRFLCLHPTLGKSLKLQPSGLKAYRVGSFRIFHRMTSHAMEVLFLESRPDVYR